MANLESLFGNSVFKHAAIKMLRTMVRENNIKTIVLEYNPDEPDEDMQIQVQLHSEKCVILSESDVQEVKQYLALKNSENDIDTEQP